MNTDKVYILQKDLPNINVGTKLILVGDKYSCMDKYDGLASLNRKLVESNPEWFKPKENKSNDSFQLTMGEEAYNTALDLCINVLGTVYKGSNIASEVIEDIKKLKKPKPQAENKPEWEILEYGDESERHTAPLWECEEKKCPIRKVKRLSDGEVFSVGDEVEYRSGDAVDWSETWPGKIESMRKLDKQIEFEILQTDEEERCVAHKFIANIRHAPKLPPQPQKEELQWVAAKEISFKRVLKTLKDNKVMIDTRDDGIYIRLAGNECDGYAFSDKFVNAYPFGKSKSQNSKQKQ